jgi:hypothetical protein
VQYGRLFLEALMLTVFNKRLRINHNCKYLSLSLFDIYNSGLVPGASAIYEGSAHLLRLVRPTVGRNKYWRKKWRLERAIIRLRFGDLFTL